MVINIEDRDGLGAKDGETLLAVMVQALYKASLGMGCVHDDMTRVGTRGTDPGNKVKENAVPDMNVYAPDMTFLIDGVKQTAAASATIAIGNGDASNDRYDLVIYDDSGDAYAVVAGTPASTPTVPDVTDDKDIPIAVVLVEANESTSIVNADITDVRAFVSPVVAYSQPVSITVSDETSDDVTVTIDTPQYQGLGYNFEPTGNNALKVFEWWLSDSQYGIDITGATPDGGVAYTTGKIMKEHSADIHGIAQTNVTGDAVLTFTESGADVWFFFMMLHGHVYVGNQALTFLA